MVHPSPFIALSTNTLKRPRSANAPDRGKTVTPARGKELGPSRSTGFAKRPVLQNATAKKLARLNAGPEFWHRGETQHGTAVSKSALPASSRTTCAETKKTTHGLQYDAQGRRIHNTTSKPQGSGAPGLASLALHADGGNFSAPGAAAHQSSAMENSVRARLRIRGDDVWYKEVESDGKAFLDALQGHAASVLASLEEDKSVRLEHEAQDSNALCDLMEDEPDITKQAKAWESFLNPERDAVEQRSSDSSGAASKAGDESVSSTPTKKASASKSLPPGELRTKRKKKLSDRRQAHTSPTSNASEPSLSHFSSIDSSLSLHNSNANSPMTPRSTDAAEVLRKKIFASARETATHDTGGRAAAQAGEGDTGAAGAVDPGAATAALRRNPFQRQVSFNDVESRMRQAEKQEQGQEVSAIASALFKGRQTTVTLAREDKDAKQTTDVLPLATRPPASDSSFAESDLTYHSTQPHDSTEANKKTKPLSRTVSFGSTNQQTASSVRPRQDATLLQKQEVKQQEHKLEENVDIIRPNEWQANLSAIGDSNSGALTQHTRTPLASTTPPLDAHPPEKHCHGHSMLISTDGENEPRVSVAPPLHVEERVLSPKCSKSDMNPIARHDTSKKRPDSPIEADSTLMTRLRSGFPFSTSLRGDSIHSGSPGSSPSSARPDSPKPKHALFLMLQHAAAQRSSFLGSDEGGESVMSPPADIASPRGLFGPLTRSLSILSLESSPTASPSQQHNIQDDAYARAATWLSYFAPESALGTSFPATAAPSKDVALFGPHALPSVFPSSPTLVLPVGRSTGARVVNSATPEVRALTMPMMHIDTPPLILPVTSKTRSRIPSVVHEEDEYDSSD